VSAATSRQEPVDLVIFDCDGVLIDSEVISTRSTVEALATVGYEVSEADGFRRFVGRSWRSIRKEIEADLGKPLPVSFEEDVERQTLAQLATSLQAIDGIGDALSRLDPPCCVASSSSVEWIRLGLQKADILHHFEPHLFSASMVENGKPAPDIFLYAAMEMGATPPGVLVVEDSLPGVQAGVAAGMTVIGFTGGSHIIDKSVHGQMLRAAGAALIIDEMTALPDVIAG